MMHRWELICMISQLALNLSLCALFGMIDQNSLRMNQPMRGPASPGMQEHMLEALIKPMKRLCDVLSECFSCVRILNWHYGVVL